MADIFRIGVVGASSLAGKELNEELASSPLAASDFVLLDVEDAVGQIAAAADEVSFIQRLEASSFQRMDFVFFAGSPETTRKYWQDARKAGASIVDMTYALEGEAGVLVQAPWVAEALAEKTTEKTAGFEYSGGGSGSSCGSDAGAGCRRSCRLSWR